METSVPFLGCFSFPTDFVSLETWHTALMTPTVIACWTVVLLTCFSPYRPETGQYCDLGTRCGETWGEEYGKQKLQMKQNCKMNMQDAHKCMSAAFHAGCIYSLTPALAHSGQELCHIGPGIWYNLPNPGTQEHRWVNNILASSGKHQGTWWPMFMIPFLHKNVTETLAYCQKKNGAI